MPTEAKINLQNEVTETENNKNNLKQAKENIDNKLIEHGGNPSTNIFNVPEKIEKTIDENYIKLAKNNGSIKKKYKIGEPGAPAEGTKTYSFEFDLKDDLLINFKPKSLKARVYVGFWEANYSLSGRYIHAGLTKNEIELINNNNMYYIGEDPNPTERNHEGTVNVEQYENKIKFTITHHFATGSPVAGFTKEAEVQIGNYTATTGPGIILG